MRIRDAAAVADDKNLEGRGQGPEPSDDEIVKLVLAGQVNEFERLVKRYQSLVFGVASRHVPAQQVEEVAQEIFIRVYRSLANFAVADSFRQWLNRIAIRSCYDYWRQHYRRKEVFEGSVKTEHDNWLELVTAHESFNEFERAASRREAAELLDWALGRLSPENRMAVSLIHLEGYSVAEAAKALGWSVTKTKVRAHRARKQLLGIIQGQE